MTVASSTEFPALMASIAFFEPAPPTMKNSSRPALSIAASTPTPWSSSWFQMASRCGAAWARFGVAAPARRPLWRTLEQVRRRLLAALDGEVRSDPVAALEAAVGERVLEAAA